MNNHVAVAKEHRQDRAVAGEVEELVGVPAGGEQARPAPASPSPVTQRPRDRDVEHRAVRVQQGVPEFAPS
jgi:hypothetical protein